MNEFGRYTETLRTIARAHDIAGRLTRYGVWRSEHRLLRRIIPRRVAYWWATR